MECTDDRNTKLPEAPSPVVLRHQVDDLRVAVTDVYSHRQVEPAYLLVEGIKIRIGDQPLPFDAAHENAAGSMLLAKLEFLQRRAHIQQGQDTNPSEPPLPLPVNVGEPAVVALGDGDFPLDFVGYLLDKNRRIKHLNVDTQLVHVFEPGRYVFHLSGFPRRFHRTARARRNVGELASGHHDPHQAAYFSVDEPVLSTALTARAHNQRTVFLVRPLHEIPGVFRLDNVSIRINGRHETTFRFALLINKSPRSARRLRRIESYYFSIFLLRALRELRGDMFISISGAAISCFVKSSPGRPRGRR